MKKINWSIITGMVLMFSTFMSCATMSSSEFNRFKSDKVAGRLLITDDSGHAFVYSLTDRAVIKTIDLGFTASNVYSTASKQLGVILGRDDNKTIFVNGGFEFIDHGDHYHLYVHKPELMKQSFNYGKPTHYQTGDYATTIFFDGLGKEGNPIDSFDEVAHVAIVHDSELERQKTPITVTLKNNMHGSAEAVGDYLIAPARIKQTGSPLADRLQLFKRNGNKYDFIKMYDIDATGLHGSATSGNYTLFAGGKSLIAFQKATNDFKSFVIPYPSEMQKYAKDAPSRIGSFAHNKNSKIFIGAAAHHLYSIDPESRKIEEIKWGAHETTEVVKYIFDSKGEHLIFLDKAGFIHIADVKDNFKTVKHIKLFSDGLNVTGHGGPTLVCNANVKALYVVNAEKKCISVIDIENGKIVDKIKGNFTPKNIAWLGFDNK